MARSPGVTRLLQQLDPDDPATEARLYRAVYDELRTTASAQLRGERQGHTLQSTDLAHEGFIKLRRDLDVVEWEWNSRRQFYRLASRAMGQILVEYARKRCALKRGGGAEHISLVDAPQAALAAEEVILFPDEADADAQVRLSNALDIYESEREVGTEGRQMFEMVYYGGVPQDEIAECFGVSARTVRRRLKDVRQRLAEILRDMP